MADPVASKEALDRAVALARGHAYEPDTQSKFFDQFDFQRVDPEEYENLPPAPAPKRYMDATPPTVWPSEAFYDRMGFMPSQIKRYGEAQSYLMSLLDGLGFGLPSAALSRVAPEAEKSASHIRKAHGNANTAGALSAALFNPANSIFRAGGNALAARGWGIMPQAAADAATFAGVSSASDLVRHGQPALNTSVAIQAAPAVAMGRVFMPRLPDSVIERALRGGAAGVVGNLPALGRGDFTTPVLGAVVGGLSAAGQRPMPRDVGSKLTLRERDYIENAVGGGAALAAAPLFAALGGWNDKDDDKTTYDPDDPVVAYKIAASRPDPKLPRQRPSFPHETEYAEPRYERFTDAMPRLD